MADGFSHWLHEPDVRRVALGVPQRVDRLRALGNALVPQIAEWIGIQIINWEKHNDKKGQAA
jgi:DNA (cytosine-5)-methyltransferase 1